MKFWFFIAFINCLKDRFRKENDDFVRWLLKWPIRYHKWKGIHISWRGMFEINNSLYEISLTLSNSERLKEFGLISFPYSTMNLIFGHDCSLLLVMNSQSSTEIFPCNKTQIYVEQVIRYVVYFMLADRQCSFTCCGVRFLLLNHYQPNFRVDLGGSKSTVLGVLLAVKNRP